MTSFQYWKGDGRAFALKSDKITPVFVSTRTTVPVVSNKNSLVETGISIDDNNNISGINNISILGQADIVLVNEDVGATPPGPSGALAYDTVTNIVYVSDGVVWKQIGATAGTIFGPVSMVDRLTKVSGLNTITETGISVDSSNNITGVSDLSISGEAVLAMINADISTYPVSIKGSIAYDILSDQLYLSNGVEWNPIASTPLPPALQSIANLVTSGNQMIYTIASNTYATSSITAAGRSFLSEPTSAQQRSALGLVIGTDVQGHTTTLDSINSIAAGPANQTIYTTGGSLSTTPLSAYVRSNIIGAANATAINTALNTITNSGISTAGAIVKVAGSGSVIQSGVSIDSLNNITGAKDVTVTGNIGAVNGAFSGNVTVTGTIDSITAVERAQIANIDSTTISSATWGFVGSMNQNVSTGGSPSFIGVNALGSNIINVADPIGAQDAATKMYVDTVASTGAPPLASVKYATNTILPNAPIYTSGAQMLTNTAGAGVALVIDGYTTLLSDVGSRVLIKDQIDTRENGVYVITDYGGGASPWLLTRASDFNQAAMPVSAGTSIFVSIVDSLSNSASSWSLASTVTNIDPLTDSVTWIQIGGVPTYVAGSGISQPSLTSGTIMTNITSRLKYTGDSIDLNTVDPAYGGTGVAMLSGNTNRVLVTDATNATNAMNILKNAPSGDFVGTTDVQTLTNKTLTSATNTIRATQLSTTGADVVISSSTPPTAGQVITATSATVASWASIPPVVSPARTLYVYQGAANVSPNYSTLGAAIAQASTLTPTLANWVKIEIFAGSYMETIPIAVPQFVCITGLTSSQGDVRIRPVAPAAASAVMTLPGNTRISGVLISGADGAGGNATYGIISSVGVVGGIDIISDVSVQNVSSSGFRCQGNGTQYSKLAYVTNCFATVSQTGFTMTTGFEVEQGGIITGIGLVANGFFNSGLAGFITYGYRVSGNYSLLEGNLIRATQVTNGAYVGGSTSASQGIYPVFRSRGAVMGRISNVGAIIDAKAVVKISDFSIEDNTDIYPSQIHVLITNPPLPNDPNYIAAAYCNVRNDRFVVTGALNNPPIFVGVNLSEVPGEQKSLFLSGVDIGFRGNPASFTSGGGTYDSLGMSVVRFDSASSTYTTLAGSSQESQVNPIDTDIATTAVIDLSSAPSTIDGVTLTSGVTRVLVKNGSTANPNVSGYSIDNGIYIWNGTGSAMTRATDLNNGTELTGKTWFSVSSGTTNYGSRWLIYGKQAGVAITNIVIGTSIITFSVGSFNPFGTAVNGNITYIGATTLPLQFSAIEVVVTSPLTTLSSTPASSVLSWEYWNSTTSTWSALPMMVTLSSAPYTNKGIQTFGYGDTVISPNVLTYEYRLGSISSTWGATLVNGVLGYWIRSRITDDSNISSLPIIQTILLGSSNLEIKSDGFVEMKGSARPTIKINIPLTTLTGTGTAGETSPIAIRLVSTASPDVIAGIFYNSVFATGVKTSALFTWAPPEDIDTSMPLNLYVLFTHPTGVSNNVIWRCDYVVLPTGSIVTTSSGSPVATSKNTTTTTLVTATAGETQKSVLVLDVLGMIAPSSTIQVKLSRLGSSDPYSRDVYITSLCFQYTRWSNGGFQS